MSPNFQQLKDSDVFCLVTAHYRVFAYLDLLDYYQQIGRPIIVFNFWYP